MRDIKFRAKIASRFPELNKMCYGTGIFEDGINTWLLSHDPTKYMADNLVHKVIDPDTIGQYTGLKDKNGKEIYEGDIVSRYGDGKHKVYWHTFTARWRTTGHTGITEGDAALSMDVIGNIYENPELLQGVV